MLVELKNGETYNGILINCDVWCVLNLAAPSLLPMSCPHAPCSVPRTCLPKASAARMSS